MPTRTLTQSEKFSLRDGIAGFGERVLFFFKYVGGLAELSTRTLYLTVTGKWEFKALIQQFMAIGNRSMSLVALIAIFTGMVLALQFTVSLKRFGLELYTGQIIGLAITRELGPVLTSLMIAARVGSGISAELGSMVVTEQVLAIRAMGASPVSKLVVPRVLATMIATPLLTIFADAIGVIGGMLITTSETDVSPRYYMDQIWKTVSMDDFTHGLAKTVFFGFFIAILACYQGLGTSGGTEGVGRSTTRAVVYSSVLIFIADFILTKLFLLI